MMQCSPCQHAPSIVNHHIIVERVQLDRFSTNIFLAFQEAISTIIICDFTVALRRRNMEKQKPTPNLSNIHLPTLSLPSQGNMAQTQRSVLGRLHESLVAEMAERPDEMDINSNHPPGSEELDVDDSDNLQDNGEV
ncbi:hypothetical protein Clacol_002284 [Clathrus columnatus]|uniref:Uncharacterized protein n=1 Tax=Clathrus columnatus TaxID=1419009 RepID=A0AAV5A381_9AGAM|nr:hypothetical protein Clacol_002284 [Clathrus columnatus]